MEARSSSGPGLQRGVSLVQCGLLARRAALARRDIRASPHQTAFGIRFGPFASLDRFASQEVQEDFTGRVFKFSAWDSRLRIYGAAPPS